MKLSVKSRISRNYGEVKEVLVDGDDSFGDVVRRLCILTGLEMEPRMFVRLADGSEVAGKDLVRDFVSQSSSSKPVHVYLETRRVSRSRWLGAITGILAGVIIALVALILFSQRKQLDAQHTVVIDAGSSHTSVYIYRWPVPVAEDGTNLGLEQMFECYLDGGIDSFAAEPVAVKAYLEPCIANATRELEAVVETTPANTRLFLGATAGMRLLELGAPQAAAAIMGNVTELLSESAFDLREGDSRILSGTEEGSYGWMATNVINGTIGGADGNVTATWGSLDMGGASLQMALQCSDAECTHNTEYTLFEQDYLLVASSDLCYGLEEATRRYVAVLIYDAFLENDGSMPQEIANPCANDFYSARDTWLVNFPATKSDIFATPCTDIQNEEFQTALDQLADDYSFTHLLSFDEAVCQEKLFKMSSGGGCGDIFASGDCLDPSRFPQPEGGFFAMSTYYYNFGMTLGFPATFEDAVEAISVMCTESSATECETCSQTDCFQVNYIFWVLTQAYHFSSDSYGNIDFVESIDGKEVAWTLGYAVSLIGGGTDPDLIESNYGKRAITDTTFGLMLAFGALMIVLASVAVCVFHRKHNDRILQRV